MRIPLLLQNLSLKRKLMVMILVVSSVGLLLASSAFTLYEFFSFRKSMAEDLITQAEIVANQSTAALSYIYKEEAAEMLSVLRSKPHIVSACLYDNSGHLFAEYPAHPAPSAAPPLHAPAQYGARFDSDFLTIHLPVEKDSERLGSVFLKSDLLEFHQRLVRYSELTLLFVLASFLITFGLSFFLQRIVSEPISNLAQTARAVSLERNYSVRAAKRGNDELGQLVDGFNAMLSQIQERDQALQQANDKLEKRVEERTSDLQMEIAERERVQVALRQQLTRISLLNQITHVISERQDLARILHAVLRQLEEHLPIDFGMVCLADPATEHLTVAAIRGRNPKRTEKLDLVAGSVLELEASGFAQCKSGVTLYVADASVVQKGLAERMAQAELRCLVGAPLMVEDKLFGILLVAREAADSFSSGECEFLKMLSEQVGLAAHQAQLHGQLSSAYEDLRKTQQAVMQQDRLRALGQMASGIAHDINNALSPIVGFSQLLLERESSLSPAARKQLGYIRTAGEDVAHIVARLRDFYRRRQEQEPLVRIDVNRLADQVIEMTRPRWRDIPQGRGLMVEVVRELEPNLPTVLGIESELREALTNLILNSVDAMPEGGHLYVRTHRETSGAGAARLTKAVVIEIQDTGIGMDEETRQRCLEPFFSTKGKRGTGMGLAMVYGVIERHEGRIDIRSAPGQGTTVCLVLPQPPESVGESVAGESDVPVSTLRILCIDDEPLVRQLMKDLLESDGHTVQVADSGQSGIDEFRTAAERNRKFDLVITDLGMPFLDGRQVARILKTESPSLPVIMLTGWGAFMKADGEMPPDVDAILSKPPRIRELRQVLTQLSVRKVPV